MNNKQKALVGLVMGLTGFNAAAQSSTAQPISPPLVSHIFTADPSAHVFKGRLFVYPSHDIETDAVNDADGGKFDMKDYHVLSLKKYGGKVKDHGVALALAGIPWASQQLWAPDAALKDGTYYLYFPAKDKEGIFRIGVASSKKPEGPFVAEPNYIQGSYSIDPSVFQDDDGSYYLYFGGIWGGQLQRWNNNQYDAKGALRKANEPALLPRVAKLSPDMKSFSEPVKEVQILDQSGQLLLEKHNDKRFFEAAWMHKYQGRYYLSYSTGDTHNICYAVADNPYGPFLYQGVLLKPVKGWTNHHSIVAYQGKWYLFYHDAHISGKTHLRNVRMTELNHNADGSIQTIEAYK